MDLGRGYDPSFMRRRIIVPALLILFAFMPFCDIEQAPLRVATTYYVATNGNDSYNGLCASYQGGSNGPFRTLSCAASKVKAGDSVQIRGGMYQEASTWSTDGTEANPIGITNFSGETVLIKGNNHTIPGTEHEVLFQIAGDWYKVSNLEICWSSGYGAIVSGYHCVVDNIYAHHNWNWGIVMTGWYSLVQNCRAYNNSLMNEYVAMRGGGWGGGITACRHPRYTTISNCKSWDNWGEGISTFESYHITIEDCISYNNQQNFYISDTKYCLFQRNIAYFTPGNMIQDYETQNNILIADEKANPASSDNTVINNLALGGERNIAAARLENGLVAFNTFVNASNTAGSESACVYFYAGSYSNAQFKNNIILQENSVAISYIEASGISFGYNDWSKTPSSGCRGTGDIIADPKLAKSGSIGAGFLNAGWFKILESSPARDRATVLSKVTEDFFRTIRGDSPDMGAYEIPIKQMQPVRIKDDIPEH